MRFVHELEELLTLPDHVVLPVRINRPCLNSCDRHLSEVEYLDIPVHAVLQNDGSAAELASALESVVDQFVATAL